MLLSLEIPFLLGNNSYTPKGHKLRFFNGPEHQ